MYFYAIQDDHLNYFLKVNSFVFIFFSKLITVFIKQKLNIMSDSGNGFDPNSSSASRHEKSLGLLTTRFVSLLQDAKDGILDLKQVCTLINSTGMFLIKFLKFNSLISIGC